MKYKTYTMEDALEEIIDYRGKTPKKSDAGIPTLSAKSVKNNHIDYSLCYYISPSEYKRFMVRGFPKVGDVLLTTEAPMGMVARLDRDDVGIAQRLLTLRGKQGVLDNEYLLYFLQSTIGQSLLKARETGTTVTGIKQAEFRKIQISIPEISVQKKIGGILRIFDQKIEINNKINENLEQQAFAMFTNLLENSSQSTCELSEIAFLNPPRSIKKGVQARCIDMAQLSTTDCFPGGWTFKAFTGGMRFTNGDTLLARITPCLENGKAAFINFLDEDEVAFGSTEYIVFSPKEEYPHEFFYCLAKHPAFIDYAIKNMNGSSGRQRVSAETIGKYILPVPNSANLATFSSTVSTFFDVIRQNSLENIRLKQLRDSLLPKLMSGELDVFSINL